MELVFVTVPLILVWLATLVDIAVRGDLQVWRKLLWALTVTLLWPTIIAYQLLRPVYGRLDSSDQVRQAPPGPRDQLVSAAMDLDARRISRATFEQRTRPLRQQPLDD